MMRPLCCHRLSLSHYCRSIAVRNISWTVALNDVTSDSTRLQPRLQRPPPGRLQRHPPRSSPEVVASGLVHDKESVTHEAQKSRIDERREVIAKRRLFLEKGLSSPALPSAAAQPGRPQKDAEAASDEVSTEPTFQTPTSTTTHEYPPKKTRSSVHSLNNGRKLSAADMHRLKRTNQRTEQQTTQIQPIQQLKNKEHRLVREGRTHQSGGSVVASLSATSRYRAQRLAKDEVESNLKTNPSVLSIPLSELDSAPVVPDDFDERFKRLKQRDKKGDGVEKKSSSLFGWFWGRK